MAKVWVLDTETKGTGANMVPLERVLRKGAEAVPGFVLPPRRRSGDEGEEPRKPYRFKVVDLMTRRDLAEDVDAQGVVAALEGVRSIVDVIVYVWDKTDGDWRRLSFGELKTLWNYRKVATREAAPPAAG
jgi:hypothetical protein